MNIKLLTEHHLEFLSLKGDFTGLSESIHVKIPQCWKTRVTAQIDSWYIVCVTPPTCPTVLWRFFSNFMDGLVMV